MLREYDASFRRLLAVFDMVIVAAAFFAAYYLQQYLSQFDAHDWIGRLYPIRVYYKLLPFAMIVWGSALYGAGAYDVFRGKSYQDVVVQLLKATFLSISCYAIIAVSFRFYYVSRAFIWIVFGLSGFLLMVERIGLIVLLRTIRKKGLNYRSVLVVGAGKRPQHFMRMVSRHKEWGLRIAGIIDEDPELIGKDILGNKVIGTLKELPHILNHSIVDDVMFIVPRSWLPKIEEPILHCEKMGKRVAVACDYFNLKFAKAKQTTLSGLPMLTFETTSDKHIQLLFKRLIDAGGSLFLLVLLSPFLSSLALIVKFSSPGPIIFKQIRSGLNGRKFWLYKFRTMSIDAEDRLAQLRAQSEMGGPAFKMTHDPRVTPLGKWLRKFSLDEFPQLINVLKGDMSLVGPRPPIPSEVEHYEVWQRRRLSMRPGLTCLWQVSGRNKIRDFNEWMRLDLTYIDQWSLWLDFVILARTIPVVLFAIGAK